jgi:glycosyltransferase involved in cell wall biosynthesis
MSNEATGTSSRTVLERGSPEDAYLKNSYKSADAQVQNQAGQTVSAGGSLGRTERLASLLQGESREQVLKLVRDRRKHALESGVVLGRAESKAECLERAIQAYRTLAIESLRVAGIGAAGNEPAVTLAADVAAIQGSGLFDAAAYAGGAEAEAMGMSPAEHYLRVGEAAGLLPSDAFDPVYYASHNPDVAEAGTSLLLHYVRYGRSENRPAQPVVGLDALEAAALAADVAAIEGSGLFDAVAYAARAEAEAMGMSSAEHYLRIGEAAGLLPSDAFDPVYYASHNLDVVETGTPLLLHYVRYGRSENRPAQPVVGSDAMEAALLAADVAAIEGSGLFDAVTYAARAEAEAMGMSPAEHYLRVGEAAGLLPSDAFDPVYYASHNPDVAETGTSLLLHYVSYGRSENRPMHPVAGSEAAKALEAAALAAALAADVAVIEGSGLFDAAAYAGRAEAEALGMSPAEHYLRVGEAAGLLPSDAFDPVYYASHNPDVAETGTSLLLHYARYGRSENRPMHPVAGSDAAKALEAALLAADVAVIEGSGLFDAAAYAGRAEAEAMGMSPAEHYLRVGEAAGLTPSDRFDPVYYELRNSDVGATNVGRLLHYIRDGYAEGRRCLPFVKTLDLSSIRLDPHRKTVAVIVHDGSRTGAPILAWNIVRNLEATYNVIVMLKRWGAIENSFQGPHAHVIRCFSDEDRFLPEFEIAAIVDKLCRSVNITYAIANSVETREFIPPLERNGVPVVALVHEFSAYTKPHGVLSKIFGSASEVVFSSRITVDSAINDYPPLSRRSYRVIPQGPSIVPPDIKNEYSYPSHQKNMPIQAGSFLVVGMGTVQIRKGVDLFIAVAAEVRRISPEAAIRFLWVGGGYEPDKDLQYSVYLREQLERSGLDGSMMVDEVDDIEPYLRRAQLFLLSSRLDPLPNVAIDAMISGLPVISFDDASGISDLLRADAATAQLVVPHLSVSAAAQTVVRLHDEPDQLSQLRQAVVQLAKTTFDMPRYIESLDALGQASCVRMQRVLAEEKVMLDSGRINLDLMRAVEDRHLPMSAAIRQHLTVSKNFKPWSGLGAGDWLRRPISGFHPLIYASECLNFDKSADEDPTIHYLKNGCPQGRWTHTVIEPSNAPLMNASVATALHGHFYYPELLADLLKKLTMNISKCDLYLTTTSTEKEDLLLALLAERGISATVSVVPNKGRDLGPFLTDLLPKLIDRYEVVGHLHGKRSPKLGFQFGERWREFLWQHLIGGKHPVMDHVLSAFSRDRHLGLVFPLDPHLIGWSENRNIAMSLANRIGVDRVLPEHFEFPIGTMFWARSDALRPLLRLKLSWNDYPEEPIDDDGTMLHALERLLPLMVGASNYKFATTVVSGVRR